mmetsp:Transcript_43311/g.103221  ORF Transcript_43311/g.103221 Transcript_43311/m.103221 type:complete len:239 (-) Transcript_43311:389-1105(-)
MALGLLGTRKHSRAGTATPGIVKAQRNLHILLASAKTRPREANEAREPLRRGSTATNLTPCLSLIQDPGPLPHDIDRRANPRLATQLSILSTINGGASETTMSITRALPRRLRRLLQLALGNSHPTTRTTPIGRSGFRQNLHRDLLQRKPAKATHLIRMPVCVVVVAPLGQGFSSGSTEDLGTVVTLLLKGTIRLKTRIPRGPAAPVRCQLKHLTSWPWDHLSLTPVLLIGQIIERST